MLPTVINLIIPASMDIPELGWKQKKAVILKKVIETLPASKIKLLTFNRDDMISAFRADDKDTIMLQITLNDIHLNYTPELTTLTDKILDVLNSKTVFVKQYAKKLKPGKKVSETSICLDVYSSRHYKVA